MSYLLAARRIPQETGLVSLQLVPTSASGWLDVEGERWPLGQTPFLVQQRVRLVSERIVDCMQHRQIDLAIRVLDDVISFIISLWDKGLTENTLNFHENYGYVSPGALLLIDVGELEWEQSRVARWQGAEGAKAILSTYSYQWLNERYPECAGYFAREVQLRLAAWKR